MACFRLLHDDDDDDEMLVLFLSGTAKELNTKIDLSSLGTALTRSRDLHRLMNEVMCC